MNGSGAQSLSILELIADASLLVQAVMLLLVLASVVSWVMIFQRSFYYRGVTQAIATFEDDFWSGRDLRSLYQELASEEHAGLSGIEQIFMAGFQEYLRLGERAGDDPEVVMQGVQRAMRVALQREEEQLESTLPFLATVGSTSPYVGLLGTVWGIMNSFRELAGVGQATLATVAPGISEALVATAMGLFAAIPAVIGYNRFATRTEVLMNRYRTFAEEFTSILHRTLHSRAQVRT